MSNNEFEKYEYLKNDISRLAHTASIGGLLWNDFLRSINQALKEATLRPDIEAVERLVDASKSDSALKNKIYRILLEHEDGRIYHTYGQNSAPLIDLAEKIFTVLSTDLERVARGIARAMNDRGDMNKDEFKGFLLEAYDGAKGSYEIDSLVIKRLYNKFKGNKDMPNQFEGIAPWLRTTEAFKVAMNNELYKNDHKPGWQKDKLLDLLYRIQDETRELLHAILKTDDIELIRKEAVDVANFAMMIWDNANRKQQENPNDK